MCGIKQRIGVCSRWWHAHFGPVRTAAGCWRRPSSSPPETLRSSAARTGRGRPPRQCRSPAAADRVGEGRPTRRGAAHKGRRQGMRPRISLRQTLMGHHPKRRHTPRSPCLRGVEAADAVKVAVEQPEGPGGQVLVRDRRRVPLGSAEGRRQLDGSQRVARQRYRPSCDGKMGGGGGLADSSQLAQLAAAGPRLVAAGALSLSQGAHLAHLQTRQVLPPPAPPRGPCPSRCTGAGQGGQLRPASASSGHACGTWRDTCGTAAAECGNRGAACGTSASAIKRL